MVADELVADARRYGFHATLKPPFRLKDGCDEAMLIVALENFTAAHAPVRLPALQVAGLGSFIALRPSVAGIEPTDMPFEPRGLQGAGRPLYTRSESDGEVRLLLRPPARSVAEYYVTTDVVERDDGSVEATLPSRQLGWVARLMLRLGSDAQVLQPVSLLDEVRSLVRQTRAIYGS